MFGSLLRSRPLRPTAPQPTQATPATQPTPTATTPTAPVPAKPARPKTITIQLANAALTLTSGTRADLSVDGNASVSHEDDKIVVTERANPRDMRSDCRVEVPRGAIVEIVSEFGGITVFNFHGTLRARLKHGNAVVNHCEGQLRLVSGTGSIEVESARGVVDMLTSSGAIKARDIDADLQAISDSGSIVLEQINGPLVARSTTGGITARELRGTTRLGTRTGAVAVFSAQQQLTVRTQKGDILVDASIVEHTTIESHKGSIELRLGRSTDARIDAVARQGVIRTERLNLATGSGRRTVKSVLGDGRARLRVETGVGVIEMSGPRSVVL